MLKRTMAMFCLFASMWVLAAPTEITVAPTADNCSCVSRIQVGSEPETMPFGAKSVYLHQNGEGEWFAVRIWRERYVHGFCWWDSCNTQEDCELWFRVTWDFHNPLNSGKTWIVDIDPMTGIPISHSLPPGSSSSGTSAGMLEVNRCGGEDSVTIRLTIDGITVTLPITIWCESCADSETDM